tara:strand:+ start:468 stop:848 length:381 start_codon:yes stop_codon:yes gene_type:complete
MALGKIKADTLEHSTAGSLDTKFVVNGSAKAWVHFDQSDHSADASLNISSITDSGAGRSDPVFANSFSSIEFCAVGSQSGSTDIDRVLAGPLGSGGGSKGFIRCRNTSGTDTDTDNVSYECLGDLA